MLINNNKYKNIECIFCKKYIQSIDKPKIFHSCTCGASYVAAFKINSSDLYNLIEEYALRVALKDIKDNDSKLKVDVKIQYLNKYQNHFNALEIYDCIIFMRLVTHSAMFKCLRMFSLN